MMELVTLTDGSIVTKDEVIAIVSSVHCLPDEQHGLPENALIRLCAQYDIVRLAHDPSYAAQITEASWKVLIANELVAQSHAMHENVRAIVRSAFQISDDGMSIKYTYPISGGDEVSA